MKNGFSLLIVLIVNIFFDLTGCSKFITKNLHAKGPKKEHTVGYDNNFVYGADVGWLSQLESRGIKWQNSGGHEQDVLQILKDKGINAVRLRTFVNPNPNGLTIQGWLQGYCNKDQTVAMAVRAKNMGFKILIDFQYADGWSSGSEFDTPNKWPKSCLTSMDSLKKYVFDYTFDVMKALKTNGVTPDWVQCGNEILNGPGFCWPLGKNIKNLDVLCAAGYDAVKAVSPSTLVVTHLASHYAGRWFFDQFFNNGGKTDIIGFSYYPYWEHVLYPKNFDKLAPDLLDMVSRYGKPIMICETGGLESNAANTNSLLTSTINTVKSLPNGYGIGIFYWEPESNQSTTGYNLGATSRVTEHVFKFTTAMDAFKTASEGNYASNPSFEADGIFTKTVAGWIKGGDTSCSFTDTTGSGHNGNYHGTQCAASRYSCSTYQTVLIPNGIYKLTAWVKSSGGQDLAQMYIKDYGGTVHERNLNYRINHWKRIAINNIKVAQGRIEFGFHSIAGGGSYLYFDDVSLIKINDQ